LLHRVGCWFVARFGLNDRDRKIPPTGMTRPSVIVRCSAIEGGSLSQPAASNLGTRYFRQVSASAGNEKIAERDKSADREIEDDFGP